MTDDKDDPPPGSSGLFGGLSPLAALARRQHAEVMGKRLVEYLHKVRSGLEDLDSPLLTDAEVLMKEGVTYQDMFGPDLSELRGALGAFRPSRPFAQTPIYELVKELLTPLTPDERVNPEFVFRWIRMRAQGDVSCPIDKANNWIVGEQLIQPMRWPSVLDNTTDTTYPQVVLTCYTCGYTFYVNAVIAGIVHHKVVSGATYSG